MERTNHTESGRISGLIDFLTLLQNSESSIKHNDNDLKKTRLQYSFLLSVYPSGLPASLAMVRLQVNHRVTGPTTGVVADSGIALLIDDAWIRFQWDS